MAGQRFVDAAKLFNASKSIAGKHLALRAQQLDTYNKTSTLARAVKSQTQRVTLTAQAAVALSQRMSQRRASPIQHSSNEARHTHRQAESQIPSSNGTPHSPLTGLNETQLAQGHDRDVFYVRSKEAGPEQPSLPHTTIPRHTEDKQGGDDHVDAVSLNQDVYYGTPEPGLEQLQEVPIPDNAAIPAQGQVPESINTDVFRTARVAQMLRGDGRPSRNQLGLEGVGETPHDRTKFATGHDQGTFHVRRGEQEIHNLTSQVAEDAEASVSPASKLDAEIATKPSQPLYELRQSKVPSSRFGRLWQYAGLGTSMAFGAVGESLRRVTGSAAAAGGSLLLSPSNMELLVSKLSRMRGAALKLGQIISFQDIKMLPPEIHQVLQRVQDSADYMPASQRDKVLSQNIGPGWRDLFTSFEERPIAAASIGQVHKAVLRSTGRPVAVKVQYPGVADSIDSDLNNLAILLTASRLLPKGLFLDKTIANARIELAWECDYIREAECQTRFRDFLADDTEVFTVPKVFPEACGPQVLTAELMMGVGVTKLSSLSQVQRDYIGTQILRLCLREIVEFKFMQTDPNWTNFLYNSSSCKIELLDFGASREYPNDFVDLYVNILIAASKNNRPGIRDLSVQLGYLTGSESQAMLNAHIESVLTLAEPFGAEAPEVYDFKDQTITDRVRGLIPVMVKERLAPPPEETYSLHRKLSGAFLLCARLGSKVRCRELFQQAIEVFELGRGKLR